MPGLPDSFAASPDAFLDTPDRVVAVLRARGREGTSEQARFTLDHWEAMAGVPCPADLANLLGAFAETGAENTALGLVVVAVSGYGAALHLPWGTRAADHAVAWEGLFDRMLDDDPGGDHATGLRDLVRNRVDLGGDPFVAYGLDAGRLTPPSASSLSALAYTAALALAHWLDWPDGAFEEAAVRVLPHLAEGSRPAKRVLALLEERGVPTAHAAPWVPDAPAPRLGVVAGAAAGVTSREWVLTLGGGLDGDVEVDATRRAWIEAAAPPAPERPCAATAIYAGLHAFLLAPEALDAWAAEAVDHPSHLVRDARRSLLAGSHPTLRTLRARVAAARACAAYPDWRVGPVRRDPLREAFLAQHGRL